MAGIRALERSDLPQVSTLFAQVMGGASAERVAPYLQRILIEDPWADPEIPPLVHEGSDGGVVGFIAASTRRMVLDGRKVRMAVSSNLVAHPDWRSKGVGALLNRKLLGGPQEFTVADRANDESRGLWLGLGGQELPGASLAWFRVLSPGSTAESLVSRRSDRLGRAARVLSRPVDALGGRFVPPPPRPAGTTEPLTAETLAEQVAAAGRRLRLRPDYDPAWLEWVLAELRRLDRGALSAELVRGPQGRVLGWFLYLLPPGGVAEVLQIGVTGPDPEPVLDHLVAHAATQGAAAVQGRLEPVTAGLLGRPGVLVRKNARALVHAEANVLGLLSSTTSLCSHLDGEWLVSHAVRQ
ncbi:GNAT family N-acetyltransferase [Actinomycetospora termitidis]|uniref:GNAT family N-acetyltransferase n=1 Tax=Actinomycetospora termitidis TaxID=3053470 RepID=A0ABT7MI65_9PSEU|nr:GNAT family N-acetyltransferase [Actinomycetospora sp. Odt1-22]MDL5160374.1 GNAT family N-acetyltransferase [Actinomycetospora sp. Odt1-22]